MSFIDLYDTCSNQFYTIVFYMVSYLILLAYVVIRNKNIFQMIQKVIFISYFFAFLLMLISVAITLDSSDCYTSPISSGLIAESEAFVHTVYLLLVFRMLNVYNNMRK